MAGLSKNGWRERALGCSEHQHDSSSLVEPELWADVVGSLLSATLDHRESVVVSLGRFTNLELTRAAPAYGFPQTIDWPILRLPLALSLYADLDSRLAMNRDERASLNDVIEAYVVETLDVLPSLGRMRVSAQVMRDRLAEIAAQMLEQDADVLGLQAFSEIFGTTEIVDSLVLEGVMSATPAGYRFVYDDVAELVEGAEA